MIAIDGIQTQTNSFMIVAAPAELKNAMPIGDDTIGRHGKKNRVAMNGAKKATPRVPSTMASKTEWEAVATKKNANIASRSFQLLLKFRKKERTTIPLSSNAKKSECVTPR